MSVVFVIPCFNASKNLDALMHSLAEQSMASGEMWRAIFIDDASVDDTREKLDSIYDSFSGCVRTIYNKDRRFALRNIVETVVDPLQGIDDDDVIAVIDGDDQLCNNETVRLLLDAYVGGDVDVAWTAHRWDVNGMNISKEMPQNVDPYQFPWCSSHLKTFKAGLLRSVAIENFKDHKGDWFKRGYDQALMLSLLYIARSRRKFIQDVCYQYNINSVSMPSRDWTEKEQLQTINLVRARGLVKGTDGGIDA